MSSERYLFGDEITEILWLIAGWRTGPQVSYWQKEHVFPMSSYLFISQRALADTWVICLCFSLVFRGSLPGTAFPESFLLDLASWLGEVARKHSSGWSESNVRCLYPTLYPQEITRDGKRERNGKGGTTEAAHQKELYKLEIFIPADWGSLFPPSLFPLPGSIFSLLDAIWSIKCVLDRDHIFLLTYI